MWRPMGPPRFMCELKFAIEDNIYVEDDTSVIEFVLSSGEYGEMDRDKVK